MDEYMDVFLVEEKKNETQKSNKMRQQIFTLTAAHIPAGETLQYVWGVQLQK